MKNKNQQLKIHPLALTILLGVMIILGNGISDTLSITRAAPSDFASTDSPPSGAKLIQKGEPGYHGQLRCPNRTCLPTDDPRWEPEDLATPSGISYPFNNDVSSIPSSDSTANTSAEEKNNLCEPEMQKFADGELEDFRGFLETNFQNKSSTSSLTTVAIGKYREMRNEFYTAYERYYPNFGSIQSMTGLQHNQCKVIIDDALSTARTLLKRHAMRTSGVKKSTALLEKYQQINAELANLYQQFIFMKAYLDTFSNKLSCYPKTGCIKG